MVNVSALSAMADSDNGTSSSNEAVIVIRVTRRGGRLMKVAMLTVFG